MTHLKDGLKRIGEWSKMSRGYGNIGNEKNRMSFWPIPVTMGIFYGLEEMELSMGWDWRGGLKPTGVASPF